MAKTVDQWYDKLKSFVPSWWFEKQVYSVAMFRAIAAMFNKIELDADDQFNSTFILRADAPVLDTLGDERDITRLNGETNPPYALRIQRITSQTDRPDIRAIVDALLIKPGCIIKEIPYDAPYCARGNFCSRNDYVSEFINSFFVIIIPKQVHTPYSFVGRSLFCGRLGFAGSEDNATAFYPSIIASVDAVKAFGEMYAIVESRY